METSSIRTSSTPALKPGSEYQNTRMGRASTFAICPWLGMARSMLWGTCVVIPWRASADIRSEEHTSELQSSDHLVCRLLLEKKKMSTPRGREYRLRRELGGGGEVTAAESNTRSQGMVAEIPRPHDGHRRARAAEILDYGRGA